MSRLLSLVMCSGSREFLSRRQEALAMIEYECPAGHIPFIIMGIGGESWPWCNYPGDCTNDPLILLCCNLLQDAPIHEGLPLGTAYGGRLGSCSQSVAGAKLF